MNEYNTVVHLLRSPDEIVNPLKLQVESMEENGAFFVFHDEDGVSYTVPIANLLMIEHCPNGYVETDEEE